MYFRNFRQDWKLLLTSRWFIGIPHHEVSNRRCSQRPISSRHKDALAVATNLFVEIIVSEGRSEVVDFARFLLKNNMKTYQNSVKMSCLECSELPIGSSHKDALTIATHLLVKIIIC